MKLASTIVLLFSLAFAYGYRTTRLQPEEILGDDLVGQNVLVGQQNLLGQNVLVGQQNLLGQKAFYVVTTPKVWTGLKESVCLVLFRELALPNGVIQVQIKSPSSKEILLERSLPLTSVSQCVEIPVESIPAERAILNVRLADVIDETREIYIRPSSEVTFIETSKPIYHPEEVLQFRVLTLNQWLRPVEEVYQKIWVVNGKSAAVMQWENVRSNSGLISLKMPIAADNLYGTWKIKALSRQNKLTEKIFQVLNYENPNILINVDTPGYILSNAENSKCKICIQNQYGQPLQGQLSARATYNKFDWEQPTVQINTPFPSDYFEGEINGCYDFVLQSNKLQWNSPKYFERNLKLYVDFIDGKTGFKEHKLIEIPVAQRSLQIRFPSTKLMKQFYKPGLPYFGHLVVEHPDHTHAIGEKINICYEMRQTPWISESKFICQQMVSNNDGLIYFTVPPTTKDIKQVIIKAQSLVYPSIEQALLLEPTYSPTDSFLSIRPKFIQSVCDSNSLEFDVLFNKQYEGQQVFYQILGRGPVTQPKLVTFTKHEQWMPNDKYLIGSEFYTPLNIPVAKFSIELPQLPVYHNSLVNRILLYYMDTQGNLIADSNVFLTTCLNEHRHSPKLAINHRDHRSFDVQLKAPIKSVCGVRLSQKRPFSTFKLLNQLLETFDVNQDVIIRDNCELRYEQSVKRTGAPYTSPYGTDETNSYNPLINYGDSWDAFNDAGLVILSNTKFDQSPCEWDVIPSNIMSQLVQNRKKEITLFGYKQRTRQNYALKHLEQSLIGDVLYWDTWDMHDANVLSKKISYRVPQLNQVYGDAVCLNNHYGFSYVNDVFKAKEQIVKLSIQAPERATIGETLLYNVHIQKPTTQCLPVQIGLETSQYYELVKNVAPMCICDTTNPIPLYIKPRTSGTFDVKVIANYINYGINETVICNPEYQVIPRFTPRSVIKKLIVRPYGIESKNLRHNLICNHVNQTEYQEYQQYSQPDVYQFAQSVEPTHVTITNELYQPALKYITRRYSAGFGNAIDALSAFASSYYLYDYSNLYPTEYFKQNYKKTLNEELLKAYQSLLTYRYSDGSFSYFRTKKPISDLALTTAAFKIFAQSKNRLSYIDKQELRKTLMWIYSQQSQDGCFYPHVERQQLNPAVWPLNIHRQVDLTAYVTASLLDSGLDFGSVPIMNAFNCLKNNTYLITGDVQTHPLSAILYSYIQAIYGDIDQSKYLLSLVPEQLIYNQHHNVYSSQIYPYLALTHLKLKDVKYATKIGRQILAQQRLWETPINYYAMTKLWPLIKTTMTPTRLQISKQEQVSTLLLNNTISQYGQYGHQINMLDNGCVMVTRDEIKKTVATMSTNFKVTIDGLDRGFFSCYQRQMRVCIRERENYHAVQPVVQVQLLTGFDVDRKLMNKMIETSIVQKYNLYNGQLLLFLKPLTTSIDTKSQCFQIPLLQRQEVPELRDAYIRIYDYYNDEDHRDIYSYKIPRTCNIQPILKSTYEIKQKHQVKEVIQGQNVIKSITHQEEHKIDYNEPEVFDCPENVIDSCPVCENELTHQVSHLLCKSDVAAVVNRNAMSKASYAQIFQSHRRHANRHGHQHQVQPKRCIAVPLNVAKKVTYSRAEELVFVDPAEKQLNLIMLQNCQCPYVKEQISGDGLVVIKQYHNVEQTNKHIYQLTENDYLVNLPLGDLKLPKCKHFVDYRA